jgi:RNA processing factor Prp31
VSEMQATEIEKVHFKEVQDITKNENYVNPVSNFLIASKASETIIFRNYNQF